MCLHTALALPLSDEAQPERAFDAWDVSAPWLAPYRARAEPVRRQLASGVPVHRALNRVGVSAQRSDTGGGAPPVSFAPADAAPVGEAYEAFIRRCGQVPTRSNLHDLFNGLVWLSFSQSKAQLNRLHDSEISAKGVGAQRGPARDAATLFDESGAVLQAPPALWQALLARDWHRLFVTLRPLWAQARLTVFGYALMEQLVHPRKNITAHVLIEEFAMPFESSDHEQGSEQTAALDAALAPCLTPARLALKPFTPLPLLGVPGWWPPNQDPAFYADARVFRPPRAAPSEAVALGRGISGGG